MRPWQETDRGPWARGAVPIQARQHLTEPGSMQGHAPLHAGADSTPAPLPLTGPPDVGLVGFGYYTPAILDLCAEAGTSVAFAVDDSEGAAGDPFGGAHALRSRGVPILSTADFVAQVRRTPELTLVAGRIECAPATPATEDPFTLAHGWTARMAGRGLLHPAALLGRVTPVRCPGRYAVFGYPGAGNVLTHNLIDDLFARAAEPAPAAWTFRAGIAEHFFQSTAARVRAALAPLGPVTFDYYEKEFGRTTVYADFGGGRVGLVSQIPSLRYHGIRTFGSHAQPVAAAVNYFTAAGAPCVIAARHPCETLLSFANKVGPSRAILDRPSFLAGTVQGMSDWYGHVLRNRDRLFVSRYEDIVARRADRLQELAARLGLSLSAGEAAELFDRYLDRNLPESVSTHFHRGGTDKWRREFTADNLQAVRRGLSDEVFTFLGYDVPEVADLLPTETSTDERVLNRVHELLPTKNSHLRLTGPYDLRVSAADPELRASLADAMDDPDLHALLAAGSLPADPPPDPPPDMPVARRRSAPGG